MIPPDVRLRRALRMRSTVLVKRIIGCSPTFPNIVRNADPDEKGETSLHLAAQLGLHEVAEYLIEHGHEDDGISRLHDGTTPLMLAAQAGEDEYKDPHLQGRLMVGRMLIEKFPENTGIKDADGMDAFAHAAKHGTIRIMKLLLQQEPPEELLQDPDAVHPFINTRDELDNTPLHHASAWGQLKTLRFLMANGADPTVRNKGGWTPVDYSASVAAEVYMKGLIRDRDQWNKIENGLNRGAVNVTRSRGGSDTQRVHSPTVKMVVGSASEESDSDRSSMPASVLSSPPSSVPNFSRNRAGTGG